MSDTARDTTRWFCASDAASAPPSAAGLGPGFEGGGVMRALALIRMERSELAQTKRAELANLAGTTLVDVVE